jgi:hypothetical protein
MSRGGNSQFKLMAAFIPGTQGLSIAGSPCGRIQGERIKNLFPPNYGNSCKK